MGDYYMTPSLIQKIDADDQVTDVAEASMMAIDETTLYAIKSETDWMTYTNSNTFFAMDTRTLKTIGEEKPEADTWPNFINVDPKSKHIFVGYCNTGAYGADYTGKGYLNEFDSQFALLHTYATGVYPVQLVFE